MYREKRRGTSRRSSGGESTSAGTPAGSANTGTSRRRQQQQSQPSTPLSSGKKNVTVTTDPIMHLNPPSVLGALLGHLIRLSNDKSKCTAALQSILDGKFVTGLAIAGGDQLPSSTTSSVAALAQAPPESPDSI
eukprot:3412042-Ditylum_brightwellii.AAC.1